MPRLPAHELTAHFQAFLSEAGLSGISVKNYVSDVRQFLIWAGIIHAAQIKHELILGYLDGIKQSKPEATYRRYTASMRRFVTFLQIEYRINLPPIDSKDNQHATTPAVQSMTTIINGFRKYLENEKRSSSTIKNYISDLNHFYGWIAKSAKNQGSQTNPADINLPESLAPKTLNTYTDYLRSSQTNTNVIHRRAAAINKFVKFAANTGLVANNQTRSPLSPLGIITDQNRFRFQASSQRSLYARYHALSFTPYLHLALLILFTTAIGIFGYSQIFKEAKSGQAYPTSPVRPTRQLSFQGRLTDSEGRPIIVATNVIFKLYNQAESGTEVYSVPTCAVIPDEDGIFSTQIGNGQCGSEIGPEVFSENASLFLEVAIGGQTLTPRQPIATSGYALNSETLQGYPASASATENTVPLVNSDGDILIGAASPSLVSTSGTFAIKGQTIALTTQTGTDGDIDIAPDGRGSVNLIGSLDKGIFVNVTDANLTTGTLIEGYVANNSRSGTLLHLASGTKQINRLTVYTTGQTDIIADTYTKPAFSIKQTGTGPIFSAKVGQTQVAQLSAAGDLGLIGGLSLGVPYSTHAWPGQILTNINSRGMAGVIINQNDSGPILAASSSGLPRFVIANNGNVGINTINPTQGSLVVVGRTWTDQFTMAKNPVSGYVLTSDNGGNATWEAPTGGGESLWQRNLGVLSPLNITDDLAIGGTATSSAKFQVFADTGDITSAAIAVAGGTVWTDSTGNLNSVAGTSGQCLTSGGASTPVWTSCADAADNFWQRNLGVLSPLNITDDLAIGGTATSSAKFQVFADTGNATTSGNLTFTGTTPTIATRLNRSLTIGDSQTGNIILAPGGTTALTAIGNDVTIADDLTINGDNITLAGNSTTIDMTGTGTLSLNTTTNRAITTGTGQITLAGNVDATNGLDVTNADLTVGGANFSVDDATGNIVTAGTLTLPNSNTLTGVASFTQFSQGIDVNGNATISGNLTLYGGARTIASRLNTTLTIGDDQTGNLIFNHNGLTGVHTTSPLATFDIRSILGTVPVASISGATSLAALVVDNSGVGDLFAASSSGLNRFVITQNGNVGIGRTNPSNLLHVNTNSNSITDSVQVGDGTYGTFIGNLTSSGFAPGITGKTSDSNDRFYIIGQIEAADDSGTTPVIQLDARRSGAAVATRPLFAIDNFGTRLVTVDKDGNFGIGNTTPGGKLDVVGNATISGNLTFYGGARTIASRLNTTLTIGDDQTGNILLAPGGTTALTAIGNDITIADDLTVVSDVTVNTLNTAGAVVYTDVNGTLRITAQGVADQCLVSAGAGTPVWTSCADAADNFWQRNLGVLSPLNITDDLAIGGTATSSAKFQIFADTGNATTSGNLTFTGTTPTIATRLNRSLTIGDSQTGNIILAPGGTTALTAIGNDITLADTLTINGTAITLAGNDTTIDMTGTGTLSLNTTTNRAITTGTGQITLAGNVDATNGLDVTTANLTVGGANFSVAPGTGNITTAGDVAVNGGNITTTATTFNLVNATATTVNFAGAATALEIGPGAATATTINLAGGSGATGCTLDGATGNFTCTGNIVGSGTGVVGYWQRALGSLSPTNLTDDVLLGATSTASAKFAFYNVAAGTPTASISGSTTNVATSLDGDGNLITTNKKSLTLGNADTGNIILNGDLVGINTTSPLATVDIRSILGTIPVASISGATSMAALIVDNSGAGDLFTASSSGLNRFVITQNGNVGIGRTIPTTNLDVAGSATISATLALGPLTEGQAGTCNASATGKIYYDGPTTAYFYCNGVAWTAFGTGSGTSFWGQSTGLLYPLNSTVDVSFGGQSTASAKFAFINIDTGTPTASIAGSTANAATYLTGDGLLATRNNQTLTLGAAGTGNLVINPSGRTAFYNTTPLASVDIRPQLGTIAVASISGATSYATLVVDNSLNYDIFTASSSGATRLRLETTGDLTLYGSSGAVSPPTGRLMPFVDAVQDLGSSTKQWHTLNLSNSINNGGSVSINLQTQHFGDNGTGRWTFDNDASVSGSLNVVGTTWLGCNVAAPPGCGNPFSSTLIVGVDGTGKIDVGTVDPPYTINNEKYATYIAGMVGQNEEIAGQIETSELVANVGYRSVIDFRSLPKASDLWLFGKVANIKEHIGRMSVILTPGSAARAWYEIDPNRKTLTVYSSKPTVVSYRLTAPRFDSEKWKNTRPAEALAGFVLNDPDLPLSQINDSPIALDATFSETNLNQYQLKLGSSIVSEIGSYANLLVANLTTGMIQTQKLFAGIGNFDLVKTGRLESPLAEIDTLRVKSSLISPLAQIDEVVAGTISAQTISSENSQFSIVNSESASISGTLYAQAIDSPEIDYLNSQLSIVNSNYATASAILASLKAKYSSFDSLNSPSIVTDPLSTTDLSSANATVSSDLAIINQPVIITDSLLVNTTLVSNSLNSADTTLYLQPTANYPINLLAGLMTLTPDGKVNVNGDLSVTGNIVAKAISLTEGLSSQTATISGSGQLLSLFNDNGDLVGSIDASGAASFGKLAGNQIITSGLVIAADQNSPLATDSATASSNATIGTATIPVGETILKIRNSGIINSTYIYLTPISDTGNQVLYVKNKQEGAGFTVAINQPIDHDVTFNYWLIQTQ